jgi:MoxR-like ATPase
VEAKPLRAADDDALARPIELARRFLDNVETVVHGKRDRIELVLAALLCGGHVLLEDVPGTAKTILARAIGQSIDGVEWARIQCTPDLQPTDVTGLSIYNQREREFEFRPGPIFANVVLVDEINRASPKTQSGLLECMQERHVTVDVHTHELARPFLVLATQNPIEYEGTYPLPEAQVDRFMLRVSLGYPPAGAEAAMLAGHETGDRVLDLEPVASPTEIVELQETVSRIRASDALRDYVVALLGQTRADPRIELGASPRAGLMLLRAAKARALLQGRDHALPDDVQALAQPVLAHRLLLAPETVGTPAEDMRRHVIADAIAATPAL